MLSKVDGSASPEPFRQQYETPLFPTGCIFKFVLQKTHGDPHYIGLNGLELYDKNNRLIPLDETVIEVSKLSICIVFFFAATRSPSFLILFICGF